MSSTDPARGMGCCAANRSVSPTETSSAWPWRQPEGLQQDPGDDGAGRDAVHPDAVLAELHRHAARELDDGGLGGAVDHRRRVPGAAGGHAGVVDDAPRALPHHDRRRVLHPEQHAAEVHRHRPLGGVQRDRLDATPGPRSARVVEETVEPAVPVDGRADHAPDVVLARDVGADEQRARPERPHDGLALRLAATGDDHGGPFLDEPLRRALAHAARRAGDDRNLALEPAHALLLAMWIRWRVRARAGNEGHHTLAHLPDGAAVRVSCAA